MSQKFLILFLLTTTHSVHSMETFDQSYSTTMTKQSTSQQQTLTWVPLPTTENTVTTSGNQSLAKRRKQKTMSLTDCPPREKNSDSGAGSKRVASRSPATTPVVEELSPVSQTLQEKIDTLRKQTAILEKEMDKRKALHHGTAPESTAVSTTLSTSTRKQATTRIEKYVYTTSSSQNSHSQNSHSQHHHLSLSKSSQPAAAPSTPSFDFSDLGLLQGTGAISSLGNLFNSAHGGLQDTNYYSSSQQQPPLTRSRSSQLLAAAAAVTASNSDKNSTFDLQFNENFDPFDFNFYQDTNQDNSSQPAPRLTRSMSSQLRAAAAAATASNSNQKCNKRKDSSKSDQDYNSSDSDESVSTEQDIDSEDEESRTKLTRRKNKVQTKSQGASSVAPSLDEDIKNAQEQIRKLRTIYTTPEQKRALKLMSKGLTKKLHFQLQPCLDKGLHCLTCNKKQSSNFNGRRHYHNEHFGKQPCIFCPKSTFTYSELEDHLKNHPDLKGIIRLIKETNHNVAIQTYVLGIPLKNESVT